jgi:hypothetical protein
LKKCFPILAGHVLDTLVRTDTKKRPTSVPTTTFQSESAATIIPHMMKKTMTMIDCGTNDLLWRLKVVNE